MTDDDLQFLALVAGIDMVGDFWTVLVIRELLVAPADEDELLDGIPGLDRRQLRERLDRLCDNGLVERDGEYHLTALGRSLRGPLAKLARWARLNLADRP